MRKDLPAELKLAVAVRFFASGDSYVSLSYNWRVGNNTISVLVREVCDAFIEEMGAEFVSLPSNPDACLKVI